MSSRVFQNVPPGYPQLAALVGRDKSFAIFRRFRTLNCRSLLYLQTEVLDLESQLRDTDERLRDSEPEALASWSAFVANDQRRKLLDQIRQKLKQYNEELLRFESVVNIEFPASDSVWVLKSWLDHARPVNDAGEAYLDDQELRGSWARRRFTFQREHRDLLTLDHDDSSPFERMLKNGLMGYLFIEDIITYGENEPKKAIWFHPKSKMEYAVTVLALILTTLLTIISMVILHVVAQPGLRLGLIGIFIILVASLLTFCGGKKTDVIIGTVGYTAVMVVFITGNG